MFGFIRLITDSGKPTTPDTPEACARETKKMHKNMPQSRIDKTLADSFPASDPPPWH